ncbi:G-protein-coupled receptor family protein [Heterostelium album PN500]|uniref:G-protein-coupled receptor family protein n=1 Tax=Heterostelium pallidum (strain ATCC 26659 / Pp 5 / PN500) TaxID=670386 RepID=D3BA09_HETP5|nr:G-protein-coupled receptor family protein [Heterostelium album PN500]EFA81396.1 G-protein-coupled receptor family protein [Heterostelium album PN500]|eukprot:XP_020433514.1 G-protein-coupled receptor family protein [Heterostelium album PN500]
MNDIILIYLICAPISIIGSLFIIITWGLFAKVGQHSGSNFIFFQSIADLIFTFKYILTIILYYAGVEQFDDSVVDTKSSSAVCFFLGMWGQYFGQATVMWSFMMTVKVFLSFFYANIDNSNSIKWYHIFVWSFCGINAIIIAAFKQYGPSSNGFHCDFNVDSLEDAEK